MVPFFKRQPLKPTLIGDLFSPRFSQPARRCNSGLISCLVRCITSMMPLALVASWPGYHDEMGLVVGLVSHGQLQWIRMNSVYGSTCHEGNGKSLPQFKRQIHKVFNSIRPRSWMTSGLTKSKGGQGLPRASTASASNAVDVVLWSKFSLTPWVNHTSLKRPEIIRYSWSIPWREGLWHFVKKTSPSSPPCCWLDQS